MGIEARDAPLLVTTSWDDGHPADLRLADLLDKHGIEGTFYVPCANSECKPVMSPSEIGLLGSRFEIGGHTQDHVSLTELDPQVAADQIGTNKHWLEDLLGREIYGFAYVRGHHNRLIRDIVERTGFRYARTIKNLACSPGFDRLQIPTTLQFYAHSRTTYLRNFLSGGPTFKRSRILGTVLAEDLMPTRFLRVATLCGRLGNHFHLWGHSWELDDHDLWNDLERLFRRLRELDARFVSNSAWCINLIEKAAGILDASPIGIGKFPRKLSASHSAAETT